ncbi:MAG: N-acetyl-gamma-glutamyl-phosphate reductase [Oscillospiraceae bacterium]|jgi:N-acetyl-gamma-glutamyl-phosphate reductase|nr:N-acetyl-gamma-glutamyl-phosphate reductase [Oscillospiraceae bacterium]
MEKFRIGIIGATGYAGVELVRLLLLHPLAEISALGSVSFEGKKISEVYPNLLEICDLPCLTNEEVIAQSDVVFAAVPHGMSQELAAQCIQNKCVFIDLGADFRLSDEEDYKQWYGGEFKFKGLHDAAVYGIPELFRGEILGKVLLANPGCYPTSIALALSPALMGGFIEPSGIIIDSKSGVTGAGRGLTQTSHYVDVNENFGAYKVAQHRHTPEIEETLSRMAGEKITVTFVPHLLPINRGILSTCYVKLKEGFTKEHLRAAYAHVYKDEPFVRILPDGLCAAVRNVKYSNICDISIHVDERTNTAVFCSAIDNMIKGAAGQAVQNMNIMLSIPETTGLELIPPAF